MGDPLGSPRVAPLFDTNNTCEFFVRELEIFSEICGPFPPSVLRTVRGDCRLADPSAKPFAGTVYRSRSAEDCLSTELARHLKSIVRTDINGCDHTSTNATDPIRTPKLSVLGRE